MTSDEIRQSFFDFFKGKGHQIVPSAPLLPDAPNLLFTNAGMNPFVPHFLGERAAPYPRIADTQKCIRAGGKHNDLEDVGKDAYHQTFFEMLGNWSFGDYFNKEAIEWAWELIVEVWKFPAERLYATVYQPSEGDPASFDQEAYGHWRRIFEKAGLDPETHIVLGGPKDNFWMMGDTGPCGPCSEIHMDLTPEGDTDGRLVNADSPFCIEIWNLVFIQFNATPEGAFEPLGSRHVDTGMGFERIAGILATTRNFADYSQPPSNYNSDLFEGLFDRLSRLSGHVYQRTLPSDPENPSNIEAKDVAFRVLADHIRCLSCAIADGILPGNEGRHYVLRRILRRAVLYGRNLGLETGFFASLVPAVVEKLGGVFPELGEQQGVIEKTLLSEEEAFGRTLDRGIRLFEQAVERLAKQAGGDSERLPKGLVLPGKVAFELYDTYGFPLDLTELMARQKGIAIDAAGFESEMEKQRARARAAQKKTDIRVADAEASARATRFVGYETLAEEAELLEVLPAESEEEAYLVFDQTPFYAEMGGQVGDTGCIDFDDRSLSVVDTVKDPGGRYLHRVHGDISELESQTASLIVDVSRRRAIERHHSATHLLHWALRKVLGPHVRQAGSLVAPDRLRFDYTHYEAPSPQQLREIEELCNERLLANDPCRWREIPYGEKPEDVIAFFGEKYGDWVRVVDIGGYSKELCGGTHVRATGEIGFMKIVADSAIAAGTRRIEAVAGESARRLVREEEEAIQSLARSLSASPAELPERVEALLAKVSELEKSLKAYRQREVGSLADQLAQSASEKDGLKLAKGVVSARDPGALRQLGAQTLGKLGEGVVVLAAESEGKAAFVALCSKRAIEAGHKAGDIVRDLAEKLGGRGGGKPDFAMGGAKSPAPLAEAIEAFSL